MAGPRNADLGRRLAGDVILNAGQFNAETRLLGQSEVAAWKLYPARLRTCTAEDRDRRIVPENVHDVVVAHVELVIFGLAE
jgi:hypothetical protein